MRPPTPAPVAWRPSGVPRQHQNFYAWRPKAWQIWMEGRIRGLVLKRRFFLAYMFIWLGWGWVGVMGGCCVGLKHSSSCPLGSEKFMYLLNTFFFFKVSCSLPPRLFHYIFLFVALYTFLLRSKVFLKNTEQLSLIFQQNK